MTDSYILPDEAAAILRVSPSTLSNWRSRGDGPQYAVIGGRIHYTERGIHEFVRESTERGNSLRSFNCPIKQAMEHIRWHSKQEQIKFVYFIQTVDGKFLKIGVGSGKVEYRLASLQTGCPLKLEAILTVPGAQRLERDLQQLFADERLVGEWFEYSERLKLLVSMILKRQARQ